MKIVVGGSASSLVPVCSRFSSFFMAHIERIEDEWRRFILCPEVENILQFNPTISTELFWGKVSQMKNPGYSDQCYPFLSYVALALLSLPVSNAACERVFSSVHLIKTKQRNRFSTKGVASLITAKEGLSGQCMNFMPSSDMLKRFDSSIYKNISDVYCDSD